MEVLSLPFDVTEPYGITYQECQIKKIPKQAHWIIKERGKKSKKVIVHIPQPITASTLDFNNPLNYSNRAAKKSAKLVSGGKYPKNHETFSFRTAVFI